MRFASIVLAALLCASCHDATRPAARYQNMSFERLGGGDLAFDLWLAPGGNVGHVAVTRQDFHAASVSFDLVADAASAGAFEGLADALAGRIPLTGSFQQSPLPTGTWARVYMARDGARVEVTNTELRDRLLLFEGLVRARL